MSNQNFSNLSKFTTPEIKTKREGAKPFNSKLQRRESFGQIASPFQSADGGNFTFGEIGQNYKDPQNITANLPKMSTEENQPSTTTFTQKGNGSSHVGPTTTKTFRSEIHRDPVKIPVKLVQNDGTERMLNSNPLDVEGFFEKMGMGNGFGGLGNMAGRPNMPTMGDINSMFSKDPSSRFSDMPDLLRRRMQAGGPAAPRPSQSTRPQGPQIPAHKVSTESNQGQGKPDNPAGASLPPKPQTKPTVHISQNSRPVPKSSTLTKVGSKDSLVDTAESSEPVDDTAIGHQVKASPPVERKNMAYHNKRRNSLKITPEMDEAFKKAQALENESQESQLKQEKVKEDHPFSLAENVLPTLENILKLAYDLAKINQNFDVQELSVLKENKKRAIELGEYLLRILLKLDDMHPDGDHERIGFLGSIILKR